MRLLTGTASVLVTMMLLLSGCDNGHKDTGGTQLDVRVDVADIIADYSTVDGVEEVEVAEPDLTNQANLFPNNPIKDDWQTFTVTLQHIDNPEGKLSGPYANVFNCLNEDGGWMREYDIPLFGMVKAQLCNLKKTIEPDEQGSYLGVEVPEDLLDPNDSFAELMMFYHVNFIHDYYKDVQGFDGMDFPLEAYVNLMGYIEMENPLPDFPTGWVTFDNAMFMPGEGFVELEEMAEEILAEYLDIEDDLALPFENDAILFMQGESLDFAYDADVIYHEYTHAVVGGDRLFGTAVDEYGTDASPTAINEAYADYFACSVLGDPIESEYALAMLSGDASRDLSEFKSCPQDYYGEEHIDGRIYSSALWAIREALGKEDADTIIFNALLTFSKLTAFEEAALATIAEAALMDPPQDKVVEELFAERGLLGCNHRVREYEDKDAGTYPHFVPGIYSTGVPGFADGAPSFLQYRFEIGDVAKSIRLEINAEPGGDMSFLSMFFGGPSSVDLSVAIKRGEEPITYHYDPEFSHTIEALIKLEKLEGDTYAAVIEGDCLTAGTYVFQFWNHGSDTALVRTMTMTASNQAMLETPTFSCDPVPEDLK
jgi:hypothetical protein